MKDNFSQQSHLYARYRPTYPEALYDYILSKVERYQQAWDVGTGNGQIATQLSLHFHHVYASDISESQLAEAPEQGNITYRVEAAEECSLPTASTDLVTVGQAVHWLYFEKFYQQVSRISREGSVIAVVGYGLATITPAIDKVMERLYNTILSDYWDEQRKYVDEHYQTIPFPFQEWNAPSFESQFDWTFDQLVGYLSSWSAVNHYITQNEESPISLIEEELKAAWGSPTYRTITFPLLVRVGRVEKEK